MTELKITPATETRHIVVLTDDEVAVLRDALRYVLYNTSNDATMRRDATLRAILDKLPKLP